LILWSSRIAAWKFWFWLDICWKGPRQWPSRKIALLLRRIVLLLRRIARLLGRIALRAIALRGRTVPGRSRILRSLDSAPVNVLQKIDDLGQVLHQRSCLEFGQASRMRVRRRVYRDVPVITPPTPWIEALQAWHDVHAYHFPVLVVASHGRANTRHTVLNSHAITPMAKVWDIRLGGYTAASCCSLGPADKALARVGRAGMDTGSARLVAGQGRMLQGGAEQSGAA
jgi:hypothetical protein